MSIKEQLRFWSKFNLKNIRNPCRTASCLLVYNEGRAPVLMRVCEQDEAGDLVDARLGFINRSGTLVIGCKFRTHYRRLNDIAFSEGLVVVQDQDLFK